MVYAPNRKEILADHPQVTVGLTFFRPLWRSGQERPDMPMRCGRAKWPCVEHQ